MHTLILILAICISQELPQKEVPVEQIAFSYVAESVLKNDDILRNKKIYFEGKTTGKNSSYLWLGHLLNYCHFGEDVEKGYCNQLSTLNDSFININHSKQSIKFKRPIKKLKGRLNNNKLSNAILELNHAIEFNDRKYVGIKITVTTYFWFQIMVQLSEDEQSVSQHWITSFEV